MDALCSLTWKAFNGCVRHRGPIRLLGKHESNNQIKNDSYTFMYVQLRLLDFNLFCSFSWRARTAPATKYEIVHEVNFTPVH